MENIFLFYAIIWLGWIMSFRAEPLTSVSLNPFLLSRLNLDKAQVVQKPLSVVAGVHLFAEWQDYG